MFPFITFWIVPSAMNPLTPLTPSKIIPIVLWKIFHSKHIFLNSRGKPKINKKKIKKRDYT